MRSGPELPSQSDSLLSGNAPVDSAKPDVEAVTDVYQKVEETGSLEEAARKLRLYAKTRGFEDDPEEADSAGEAYDEEEIQENGGREEVGEVVHLQEVVEGLWIGDLVAAMDQKGLEQRGIAS